jgi:hypothetical protein
MEGMIMKPILISATGIISHTMLEKYSMNKIGENVSCRIKTVLLDAWHIKVYSTDPIL